jgi:tetratricopeptide (TPR) repeat protein
VYRRNEVENWPGAIAYCTAVIKRDPRNVAAYETRAYTSMRSGAFRRAIDDATEMLRLDPNSSAAYSHRGSAYNGLREWDHAIVDLNKYLAIDPKAAWPTFLRGHAHEAKGDVERALLDFNRAIELEPKLVNHFWIGRGWLRARNGDVDGGLADLGEATRIGSEAHKYFSYRSRAELNTYLSLIDPAIADYTEVIRRDRKRVESQAPRIFSSRGALYLARGEVDRALADLDDAIRLNPRIGSVYYSRGLARTRKGLWDQAIGDFEDGVKACGGKKFWTAACLVGCGETLAISGRIEQAEAAFEKALKFDPGRLHQVLMSRAWFINRPRADYEAALKNLDEPAKTGMIIPFLYRGLIYGRMGKPDLALADFTEVINRVKSRPDWFATADYAPRRLMLLLGRGEACLQKGDLDRALAESDEAVRFAPWSAEARQLRGLVHAKRGDQALAELDRKTATGLVPDPILARPKTRAVGDDVRR